LLDDRLEVLPAARQLGAQPSRFLSRAARRLAWGLDGAGWFLPGAGGRLLEEDEKVRLLGRPQWMDLDIDRLPTPVATHLEARPSDGRPGFPGLLERSPEAVEQALARHLEDAQARVAGSGLEERSRLAPELAHLEVAVDDQPGRGVALLDEAARLALDVLRIVASRDGVVTLELRTRVLERHRRIARAGLLLVDAALLVGGREELHLHADRLGRAEDEETRRAEGVVENMHEAVLKLPAEIDEHVPAEDQVEPREGRVAGQVLPREHAHVADRLVDAVGAVDPGEEAPQAVGRHVAGDA